MYVDDKNDYKEAACGSHVEEIDEKTLISMNPHHVLTMYIWDALNVNANRMKSLLNSIQRCLNHVFLPEHLKNIKVGKTHAKTMAWFYGMEGRAQKKR